jgi:hypothetical protein
MQTSGNLVSDMDGEKVMLSINSGKYYNLGPIGGRIWDIASSPITVNQIIEVLVSEYEVDWNTCEDQVISFVTNLLKENIIQIVEEVKA